MDMQKLIDTMAANNSATRGDYHLTLGKLRDALESAPDCLPVIFDSGGAAGDFGSYRGYYIDIAIDTAAKAAPVKKWRKKVAAALSTVFVGYKGGDYPASPGKPLWRAEYGTASGTAIIGVEVRDDAFVLTTKHVD
jgi:hypothetical protein